MKAGKDTRKLTLSAMFMAIAFVLPFLTGQIPQIGSMLCPMHIPVLLCGFFCGGARAECRNKLFPFKSNEKKRH